MSEEHQEIPETGIITPDASEVPSIIDSLMSDVNILPKYDGFIHLGYTAESGDFEVSVDFEDTSEKSAETMALIMLLCQEGKLSDYISQALILWLENDPSEKRGQFLDTVIEHYAAYEEVMEKAKVNQTNLMKPSEVFNFKDLK